MNKTLIVLAMAMLIVMPVIAATDVGQGVGITVNTQKFAPRVWMCDSRTTQDDNTQNGQNKLLFSERKHNYAFEGESIHWTVLVMDKNKIEEVTEVVGTVGSSQAENDNPNEVEVECKRIDGPLGRHDEWVSSPSEGKYGILKSCNAKIDQFVVKDFNSNVMAYYDCRLTVETPNSMHGEYFLTVEAKDFTGLSRAMAENEYWFLNPTIALSIDGNLEFDEVMPGTDSYSNTLLVGNDAEAGSGVILDMFISGTDFYDPSSSGARCPSTNQLALTNFGYFVTNGAFSSSLNGIPIGVRPVCGGATVQDVDPEGYVSMPYSTDISGAKRIMRWNTLTRGESPSSSVVALDWNCGNALSPGSEMALTFKLSMPEPCVGDFSEGQIYFWGEAI